MATRPYTAFLPEVVPSAPGVPEIVAINAIRNAAIEFCSTSLVWFEVQEPVEVSASDFPLDLSAPSGAVVDTILSAKANGMPLTPKTLESLDGALDWENATGQPSAYYQPTPEQLRVVPLPTDTFTLTLRVAYTPTRASTSVEGFLYERYLEAIAGGALWRLMSTPSQPYTNATQAAFYKAVFDAGVRKATLDAQKAFTTASSRANGGFF